MGLCPSPGTPSALIRTGEDQSKILEALDASDSMHTKHSSRPGDGEPLKGLHVHGRGVKKMDIHHVSSSRHPETNEEGHYRHPNAPAVMKHLGDLHHSDALKQHGPVVTLSDVTSTLLYTGGHRATKLNIDLWVAHW